MPKINVTDAVVRVMESEGVDVVFGVPGAAILPLYKALSTSSIRHVSVRHEEGGTHAADTDAAIDVAIDAINEYEPIIDGLAERVGGVVGALPERD
jgi:glyoxylate carboligase